MLFKALMLIINAGFGRCVYLVTPSELYLALTDAQLQEFIIVLDMYPVLHRRNHYETTYKLTFTKEGNRSDEPAD